MQLGIDLALAGHPPLFLPEARVDSPLPQQAHRRPHPAHPLGARPPEDAADPSSPPALPWPSRHRRLDLFWLGLDLAIPPLALLACSWLAVWAFALVLVSAGASPAPLVAVTFLGTMLTIAVFAGWAAHCHQQIPLAALLAAPLYAAWKLPIYAAFLVKRQREWIRTQRDVPT